MNSIHWTLCPTLIGRFKLTYETASLDGLRTEHVCVPMCFLFKVPIQLFVAVVRKVNTSMLIPFLVHHRVISIILMEQNFPLNGFKNSNTWINTSSERYTTSALNWDKLYLKVFKTSIFGPYLHWFYKNEKCNFTGAFITYYLNSSTSKW